MDGSHEADNFAFIADGTALTGMEENFLRRAIGETFDLEAVHDFFKGAFDVIEVNSVFVRIPGKRIALAAHGNGKDHLFFWEIRKRQGFGNEDAPHFKDGRSFALTGLVIRNGRKQARGQRSPDGAKIIADGVDDLQGLTAAVISRKAKVIKDLGIIEAVGHDFIKADTGQGVANHVLYIFDRVLAAAGHVEFRRL